MRHVAILALAWLFAAADRTVTFRIEGMSCEPCTSAIEMQLGETKGVTGYTVSFEDAEARVSYDPTRITPEEIARSIGATGFRAFVKDPPAPETSKSLADSLAPLAADFNAASGRPRFLAILSPSCELCLHGAMAVRDALLQDGSLPAFDVFVVWAPMLGGDNEVVSRKSAALVAHPRVRQYWDPGRRAGGAFRNDVFPDAVAQMRASLPEAHPLRKPFETRDPKLAEWDIYLFFGPDAEWTSRAPKPTRFVRQVTKTGARSVLWKNDYSVAPFEASLVDALRTEARALGSK